MDLDSTAALLLSTLPVGGDPNSVKKKKKSPPKPYEDSEEEEIFFGAEKSDKEKNGKNSKLSHRETVYIGQAMGGPKRSIDIHKTPTKLWTQYRVPKEDDTLEESAERENGAIIEENEENADPQPSPRKINMEKLEPCERKYRSRSPLKHSPDNFPTPPRKVGKGKGSEEDCDTSKENSIIDVDNDQIFDDSIFTVYSDNDLSRMHSKISKKWRKKWDKDDVSKRTFTADTIDRLVAKHESIVELEDEEKEEEEDNGKLAADEKSLLQSPSASQTDQLQNLSTCSDWFNTTRDEMILFEKFGEEYDVVVNQMTHDEKAKLKQEVENCTPKEASELLAMHQSTVSEDEQQGSSGMSPVPSPVPIPKPRTMTPVKETPMKMFPPLSSDKSPGGERRLFKTPQQTPNYLRPTTASRLRMSPRKHLSPQLRTNDVTPCPRSGFASSSNDAPKPKSLKKTLPSNVDLNKIVSPVAQYIRSNPAPPIMRQIRPKVTRHFDDDLAAFEREEELLRTPESEKKKRLFRPLPAAEYQTSQVALQQQVTSPNQHLKALPKVFGVHPTVEAKVIRHVGRERVPKDAEFLRQNSPLGSHLLFRKDSLMPHDSLDDTNTMEISVRQCIEVKKMTKQ